MSRNTSAAVKALQEQYSSKGVEIFMLNSTPANKREAIVAEAQAYGYNLPILMDTNQLVGEQLGVTRTAEAIVIDPKTWKIVYRGPIDDRVTYERQKAAADMDVIAARTQTDCNGLAHGLSHIPCATRAATILSSSAAWGSSADSKVMSAWA